MTDWSTYTDEELWEMQQGATAERTRRQQLVDIPASIAALNVEYLDVAGVEQGEAWVQPTGAHDAYPKGWLVSHVDKTWESLVDANVWEPPTQWREQTAPGEYPEWVQPVGSEDAYNTGDRVHYMPLDGDFESLIDANVWSPEAYPAGWLAL